MALTVEEARNKLAALEVGLFRVKAMADHILAETPRTEPYYEIRRAARYASSGTIPSLLELDERTWL